MPKLLDQLAQLSVKDANAAIDAMASSTSNSSAIEGITITTESLANKWKARLADYKAELKITQPTQAPE